MYINDNIYAIQASRDAYSYVLCAGEKNVLIDASLEKNASAMIEELRNARFDKIDAIFLTHSDMDHIGGCKILSDHFSAPVFLSARELKSMSDPTTNKKGRANAFEGISLPELTPFERDGGEIFGIKIIPTYGHTYGHLCFSYNGTLFIGDLLAERDGDLVELDANFIRDHEESLRAIDLINKTERFSLVCPTHGEPFKANKLILSEKEPWLPAWQP